eukprot:7376290-Prymnesium_polylepis.2
MSTRRPTVRSSVTSPVNMHEACQAWASRSWVVDGGTSAGMRPGGVLWRANEAASSLCTCQRLRATQSRTRLGTRFTAAPTTRHVLCPLLPASL